MVARAVFVAPKVPIKTLWSNSFGIEIFRKTMSRVQFVMITRYLRFEDKETRQQRIDESDKFAAVSEYWFTLIRNFQKFYIPSCYLTID